MTLSSQYAGGSVANSRLVANVAFDGHVRCCLFAEYPCLLHTSKTGSLQESCLSGLSRGERAETNQVQRSVKGQTKDLSESEAETSTGRQPRVGGGQWAARATGHWGAGCGTRSH